MSSVWSSLSQQQSSFVSFRFLSIWIIFFFNSQPTFLGQEDKVCSVSAEGEGPEEPLEGLDGRTAAEDRVWGDGLDLAFQGCHLPF